MFALHARYRGHSTRRADLVERSAQALSTMEGVEGFELVGVEDIRSRILSPEALCNVVMALLSDGEWAIGLGIGHSGGADGEGSRKNNPRGEPASPSSAPLPEDPLTLASGCVGLRAKAGTVSVATVANGMHSAASRASGASASSPTAASDIVAVFILLGHVLAKRTVEGREATSLVRKGLSQNEAAEELGISKQAMSQRLQAAGWQAENAGWQLAVNVITAAAR